MSIERFTGEIGVFFLMPKDHQREGDIPFSALFAALDNSRSTCYLHVLRRKKNE